MSLNHYHTIDDFLGSKESRYFGSGYVNTAQHISNFTVIEKNEVIDFSCTGTVQLPELWSAKDSGKQKPHLSSIDAIEFTIKCLGIVFQRTVQGREFSIELIERLDILAGKEPIEEDLNSIPITGQIKKGPMGAELLEMRISNMKVSLVFLTENLKSKFLVGDEKQSMLINDLLFNRDSLKASAIVSPVHKNSAESWSLSSCFAASLQLGQVLLYKLDGIARETSNTLWMRKISINLSQGIPALDMSQPIYTKLDNVKKLKMAGADWRCADIFSIMCNTNIVCSVAHKL